ncbi:hypothetical protein MtrunA17_Chr7g0251731 [Medicago truncatula]|nr:hypothetical protein MtrunA17_Chr7g0251731 [Medicago truncatula]
MRVIFILVETTNEVKIMFGHNILVMSFVLKSCTRCHAMLGVVSNQVKIELTNVLSSKHVIVIGQYFHHIENMRPNSNQYFNFSTVDSRLARVEQLSAKVHVLAILIEVLSSFTSYIDLAKLGLFEEADELSMRSTFAESVYNDVVFGICLSYMINEAFNWVHMMVKKGAAPGLGMMTHVEFGLKFITSFWDVMIVSLVHFAKTRCTATNFGLI